MSRWSEAFGALSEGADTLDRVRHSDDPLKKVSQSVSSVTAAARTSLLISGGSCSAASWGNIETERTGIAGHESRPPREWAEGIAKLNPDHPPADVPARRWSVSISDCGHFLAGAFAAKAAALGWTQMDIFGCDRDRPFARIDQTGLLWLLNRDRLIALSENTATVETNTGARQTWRRRPNQPCRTLPWEFYDGRHE